MTKVALYLASLMLGTNFSASTAPPAHEPLPAAVTLTAPEKQLVERVNAERWDRGERVLAINPVLVKAAREHSREMGERSYFDHYSPTPSLRTPVDRYVAALGRKPTHALIGENLFRCTVQDADLAHRCLMNSPRHRDNLLNPLYDQIGVGAYVAPDGRFYVTQLFLSQID